MRRGVIFCLGSVALAFEVAAQSAVDVARPEERQEARQAVVKEQEKRAKRASIIEFRGEQAFKEKELRTALKEEITTIEDFGLSSGRSGLLPRSFLPETRLRESERALRDRIGGSIASGYY